MFRPKVRQNRNTGPFCFGEVKTVANVANFLLGDFGYEVHEGFRAKLEDIDAVDTLKDYLENSSEK